jgi:hypothetical protein
MNGYADIAFKLVTEGNFKGARNRLLTLVMDPRRHTYEPTQDAPRSSWYSGSNANDRGSAEIARAT